MEKIIKLMVFAGAKKEKVELADSSDSYELRVFVREPAQKNMANKRVRELVARHYEVAISDVQILTGHRSPKKRLKVNIEVD